MHIVGLFKTDSSIFVLLLYQRAVHNRGKGNAVGVEWVGMSVRVIWDSKSERKVYEMVVRPTVMHGLETVVLTKRQEAEPEVAELKILWFSMGVSRMDRIRSENFCQAGEKEVCGYSEGGVDVTQVETGQDGGR